MNEFSRRSFLQSAVMLAAGVHSLIRFSDQNNPLVTELALVRLRWYERAMPPPTKIFESVDIMSIPGAELQKLFAEDFHKGRTFDVDGLLLSETEAAILVLASENLEVA